MESVIAGTSGLLASYSPDCFRWIEAASFAPADHFNRIDPPVARFRLVYERVGTLQFASQLSLGEIGLQTPLSKQLTQPPVCGVMLRLCAHPGRTLDCPKDAPSWGAV